MQDHRGSFCFRQYSYNSNSITCNIIDNMKKNYIHDKSNIRFRRHYTSGQHLQKLPPLNLHKCKRRNFKFVQTHNLLNGCGHNSHNIYLWNFWTCRG
nr:hypothetical protein CFP56_33943 [Quercus suber]